MKALGQRPSEAELRDMMKQVDEDDFDEFVKMMSDRLITEAEVQRKRQSRIRLGRERADRLSGAEAADAQPGEQLTDEEVELMMKEADRNEDGFVDFDGKMVVGDLRA
uniref:EF-hand domain-containing protein n=1 Tax=Macrostomum lignano TaxID=282301 RepID=A0A1I8FIR7_9PLAT